jgi:hypothetical protein
MRFICVCASLRDTSAVMAVKSCLTKADLIEKMNENELKLYLDEHNLGSTITSTLQCKCLFQSLF